MLNGNSQQRQMIQRMQMIKNMLSGKNPTELYQSMMQTDPRFQKFVKENENKSIEDIALEYDLDLNFLKQLMM